MGILSAVLSRDSSSRHGGCTVSSDHLDILCVYQTKKVRETLLNSRLILANFIII